MIRAAGERFPAKSLRQQWRRFVFVPAGWAIYIEMLNARVEIHGAAEPVSLGAGLECLAQGGPHIWIAAGGAAC